MVGCKADKQSDELLSELLPFVSRVYVTLPPVDDAVPVEKLAQKVRNSGIVTSEYPDPIVAIQAALEHRSTDETILVAGSLFLVAVVREFLLADVASLAIAG